MGNEMINSDCKNILFIFIIMLVFLFGISLITALSIGTGIRLNITINDTGTNYTDYNVTNSTNTNSTITNITSQTNIANNQTNTNTNTDINTDDDNSAENQAQNSTTSSSVRTTKTPDPTVQTNPKSPATTQKSTLNQDDKEITSGSSTSKDKNNIEISKMIMILPTMILIDLFIITYALYKNNQLSYS